MEPWRKRRKECEACDLRKQGNKAGVSFVVPAREVQAAQSPENSPSADDTVENNDYRE